MQRPGNHDCNGHPDEANMADKVPHQPHVHAQNQKTAVRDGAEFALDLEEALCAFEYDESRYCADHYAKVYADEVGGFAVGYKMYENYFREDPQEGKRDGKTEEKKHHALAIEAYQILAAGSISLRA